MKTLIAELMDFGEKEWRALEKMTGVTAADMGTTVRTEEDADYYLTLVAPGYEDEDGNEETISSERTIMIAKAIAKDGFDISGFELNSISEPHVLSFFEIDGHRAFDYVWEEDGRCYPSYSIQNPEAPRTLLMVDATSIAEAVEKFVDLDTLP